MRPELTPDEIEEKIICYSFRKKERTNYCFSDRYLFLPRKGVKLLEGDSNSLNLLKCLLRGRVVMGSNPIF